MEERERAWEKAVERRPGRRIPAAQAAAAVLLPAAAVVFFRWLFPLLLPLFLGWFLALPLRPVVSRLRRSFRFPEGLAIGTALGLALCATAGLAYGVLRLAGGPVSHCLEQLPALFASLQTALVRVGAWIEPRLGLADGTFQRWTEEQMQRAAASLSERLTVQSFGTLQGLFSLGAGLAFALLYTVLWLKEGERVRKAVRCRVGESPRGRKVLQLVASLRKLCVSWLACEGRILGTTCLLCTAVLWMLHISGAPALGVLVGLLDALPLLGTGTVLIPWSLYSFFSGKWLRGAVLLSLCLVCSFLRDAWEARCFSRRLGGSGLASVTAMLLGWRLGGFAGLILGPMAWILIREALRIFTAE